MFLRFHETKKKLNSRMLKTVTITLYHWIFFCAICVNHRNLKEIAYSVFKFLFTKVLLTRNLFSLNIL